MNNDTLLFENRLKTVALFEERNAEDKFECVALYAGFGERERIATYSSRQEALERFIADSDAYLAAQEKLNA